MRIGRVPSGDIYGAGLRLTSGFHLAEDQAAIRALEKLERTSCPLHQVTGSRGVFSGPIFTRRFVPNPEMGHPYSAPAEFERAEFKPRRYLALSHGSLLDELQIRRGMILVTCSGMNLGRAIWVRSSMAGVCASHDLIRIDADPAKIPPGYLFAFLSCRYGHAAIRKLLYGGNIKHVEPGHVAGIYVPRFDAVTEEHTHDLVIRGGAEVENYESLIHRATDAVFESLGFEDSAPHHWHSDPRALGWAERGFSTESLRSWNYEPRAKELKEKFMAGDSDPLGSLCDPSLFRGKVMFKRIDSEPGAGIRMVGQRAAFRLHPDGRWLSRKSIRGLGLQVPPQATLIPSHGTLGEHELYCQALIVTERMSRWAFSGDFFRCAPLPERVEGGYLFAFLRSNASFRILRSFSVGGKQQEQHAGMMWRFPVPRLDRTKELVVSRLVYEACDSLDRGAAAHDEARKLVENAIEEAA